MTDRSRSEPGFEAGFKASSIPDEGPSQETGLGPQVALWVTTDPLPHFARYDGVDLVVITLADYDELVALREDDRASANGRTRRQSKQARKRRRPLTVSRWESDPEVAEFVTARLGRVQQKDIREQIIERFGQDRAPSLSALNRFAVAWDERRR